MINLLPREEQLELQRSYRFHVAIISMWLLFFAVLLSLIMLVPSYIVFSGQNEHAASLLKAQNETDVVKQAEEALSTLGSIQTKTTALGGNNTQYLSEVIKRVVADKTQGISLNKIEYTRGANIIITGLATTRENMRIFVKSLETSPYYSRVDSPISNLLGNKDIKFSIVLYPKNQ